MERERERERETMDLFSRFVPTLGFAVFRFVFGSSGSADLYPKIPLPFFPLLFLLPFKMKYCRLWISEAAETLPSALNSK